jgi:glucan phosphoethanolaminetransferase (alkaline phosphatase superfamily)
MQLSRLITHANPIVLQRSRWVTYYLVGIAASAGLGLLLSILGAICISMPLAMLFSVMTAAKLPTFLIPVSAIVAGLAIWIGQYFAGFLYMDTVSRLGFGNRKEVLTPLFLASITLWGVVALVVLQSNGLFNFGSFVILTGVGINLFGQRKRMKQLRKALPNNDSNVRFVSQSDFNNELYELKTAENIEHLEQLSKQCLLIMKPAASASSDCTSALIDELMKRKLRAEADELSLLQLKLSEQ